MRHKVALQRATRTKDTTSGQVSLSWLTIATVRAAINPLSGREFFAAQQAKSNVSHRVTIRNSTDVNDLTPKDRVLFGSRALNIVSVIRPEEQTGRHMDLMCEEAV